MRCNKRRFVYSNLVLTLPFVVSKVHPERVEGSNHEDRLGTSLMNSGGYPRSNRHFINEIASQSENAIELATVIEGDFIKMP
jgi:hypothetical protein